ncbi:MAG: PKD domain-containing protein, partial [Candidatus Aenigmarchaeota archaeon]|nr:PKD domain-containing protein [Candidatus Aenigmarchaeota archaeon]
AQTNQLVTYLSSVSGGTGSYNYYWSGACSSSAANCQRSFSMPGGYTSSVNVVSGNQTQSAICSVDVQSVSNDPVTGTLFVSNNNVCLGNSVSLNISAQDDQGVDQVCITNEIGATFCQPCSNETSCARTWAVSRSQPGDYQFSGTVTGRRPDGTSETNSTNPQFQTITFRNCNPQLQVSCSASPNPAQVNQQVAFTSFASGGAGSYNYSWSGDCTGSSSTCYRSFYQTGGYSATVNVTSDNQSQSASCSVSVVSSQNPLYVSVSSYPNPAQINQTVTFNSNVSGGTGFYNYYWSGACTGSGSTCQRSFSQSGTYSAVLNVISGNQSQSASTSVQVQGSANYLGCFDNDVYWLDSQGGIQNKAQECGVSSCDGFGINYCSNNNVYKQRSCYTRGCASGACYATAYNDNQLIQSCSYYQQCQNGQCGGPTITPVPQCSGGPCCEGGYLKSSASICNIETDAQYGCPWGLSCTADVGKRTKTRFQYCSGVSSVCGGRLTDWTYSAWQASDYCSYGESCVPGVPTCQLQYNCPMPTGQYIKNYRKSCYQSDLYWYDSNGARQDVYQKCADNNSCTIDTCENGGCSNKLVCDGTTCQIGSQDYVSSCSTCGDGICSAGENIATCQQDCLTEDLIIAVLGKKQSAPREWKEEVEVKSAEKVDILVVVANGTNIVLNNLIVKVRLPEEISYQGDLKIQGQALGGDIQNGIAIESLAVNEVKAITFSAESRSIGNLELASVEISGEAQAGNLTGSDSMKIVIRRTSFGFLASIGAFFKAVFSDWRFWLLLAIIIIIYFVIRPLYFWVSPRREKTA